MSGADATGMRAAVVGADLSIGVRDVARPACGPGMVRVAVDACGLCGSDLHFHHAKSWPEGLIPGHEITGRIEAIGDAPPALVTERGLEVGRRVVVEPLVSCGTCAHCRAGRDSICPSLTLAGVSRAGGFADSIVMPALRIHPVAEDLDPSVAALAEPLAVSLHGLDRSGFTPQDRVLVLGAGAIGVLTAFVAHQAGAREVVVRARHPFQAEQVREIAGAEARDAHRSIDEDGLDGAFDLVIETVGGASETLVDAARAARPGGRVGILGLFEPTPPMSPMEALVKELTFHWSNCYCRHVRTPETSDFSDAAALLARERERLAGLVTHRVPLDSIGEAFAIASDKRRGVGKVCVVRSARSRGSS
ncbi:MAG: alcohol dehydrogenase catalytic domain-containing protein [Myxococcota bacterium]